MHGPGMHALAACVHNCLVTKDVSNILLPVPKMQM